MTFAEIVLGAPYAHQLSEDHAMLRWAIAFLLIALIAAFLGFGGVAYLSYDAAKLLIFAFLVVVVLSFIAGALRRPRV
jgi:uncharacterized membrane protein YtjA (UPF0391 family)